MVFSDAGCVLDVGEIPRIRGKGHLSHLLRRPPGPRSVRRWRPPPGRRILASPVLSANSGYASPTIYRIPPKQPRPTTCLRARSRLLHSDVGEIMVKQGKLDKIFLARGQPRRLRLRGLQLTLFLGIKRFLCAEISTGRSAAGDLTTSRSPFRRRPVPNVLMISCMGSLPAPSGGFERLVHAGYGRRVVVQAGGVG